MNQRAVLRKGSIIIASSILLLLLMIWVPTVYAAPQKQVSHFVNDAGKAVIQSTPTEDPTVTALNKELSTLQVKQLQNPGDWFSSNSGALIAALAAIAVAAFGIFEWAGTTAQAKDKDMKDREDERRKEVEAQEKDLKDRKDERRKEVEAQEKDLNNQAEERFQKVVEWLGNDKEQARVGAAVMLQRFVQPGYEKSAQRGIENFYRQTFELAVAHLRLQPTPTDLSQPPSPLNQALTAILRDAFPYVSDLLKKQYGEKDYFKPDILFRVLDAGYVKLDKAYLYDVHFEQIWMPGAFLRHAFLQSAHLTGAELKDARLMGANLSGADLTNADLSGADLTKVDLTNADLSGTTLIRTILKGAILEGAILKKTDIATDLTEADLSGANLSGAILEDVNLHEARYNKKTMQEKDADGKPLPLGPTQWPQGFDPAISGAICIDC